MSSGTDPFLNTNTRNIIKHTIIPKIVGSGSNYTVKSDIINIDNIYATGDIYGPPNVQVKMIATGDSGYIMSSDDYGLTWTTLNTGGTYTLKTCYDIKWNGSYYLALGNPTTIGDASILMSYDAITWIPCINTFSSAGFEAVWNGEFWVAVGQGTLNIKNILISRNGLNWSEPTDTVPANSVLYGIAYSNGRWVATGAIDLSGGGITMYSDDAQRWTASSSSFAYSGSGVTSDGQKTWVAVGQELGSGGGTNTVAYSTDNGETWKFASGMLFDVIGTSVRYHDGKFVAVGQTSNSRNIIYSTDGVIWSASTGTIFSLYADTISWNGKRWVSTGSNNTTQPAPVLLSSDGITWTAATSGSILYSPTFNSFGLGSNNVWNNTPTSINSAMQMLSFRVFNQSSTPI